jgi:hypothetical protein
MQAIWRVPLGEGKPWRASVEVYRILGIVGGQAGGAKDECALPKVQLRKIRVEIMSWAAYCIRGLRNGKLLRKPRRCGG